MMTIKKIDECIIHDAILKLDIMIEEMTAHKDMQTVRKYLVRVIKLSNTNILMFAQVERVTAKFKEFERRIISNEAKPVELAACKSCGSTYNEHSHSVTVRHTDGTESIAMMCGNCYGVASPKLMMRGRYVN